MAAKLLDDGVRNCPICEVGLDGNVGKKCTNGHEICVSCSDRLKGLCPSCRGSLISNHSSNAVDGSPLIEKDKLMLEVRNENHFKKSNVFTIHRIKGHGNCGIYALAVGVLMNILDHSEVRKPSFKGLQSFNISKPNQANMKKYKKGFEIVKARNWGHRVVWLYFHLKEKYSVDDCSYCLCCADIILNFLRESNFEENWHKKHQDKSRELQELPFEYAKMLVDSLPNRGADLIEQGIFQNLISKTITCDELDGEVLRPMGSRHHYEDKIWDDDTDFSFVGTLNLIQIGFYFALKHPDFNRRYWDAPEVFAYFAKSENVSVVVWQESVLGCKDYYATSQFTYFHTPDPTSVIHILYEGNHYSLLVPKNPNKTLEDLKAWYNAHSIGSVVPIERVNSRKNAFDQHLSILEKVMYSEYAMAYCKKKNFMLESTLPLCDTIGERLEEKMEVAEDAQEKRNHAQKKSLEEEVT